MSITSVSIESGSVKLSVTRRFTENAVSTVAGSGTASDGSNGDGKVRGNI